MWDEHLLVMLEVKNKLLLDEALLEQHSLQIEDVRELADTQHELDFVKLVLDYLLVVLVLYQNSIGALLVHIDLGVLVFVDQRFQVNVLTLRLVCENEQVALLWQTCSAESPACINQLALFELAAVAAAILIEAFTTSSSDVFLKEQIDAVLLLLIELLDAPYSEQLELLHAINLLFSLFENRVVG